MTLQVSEISITIPSHTTDRFLAYATICLDDSIVIRNIRIIAGVQGKLHVQMPSRRCCVPCASCREMVANDSTFCPKCGRPLRTDVDPPRPFEDLAYPANPEQRDAINQAVLDAYGLLVRAQAGDAAAPLRDRIRLRHGEELV